jgi:hypothetical protein
MPPERGAGETAERAERGRWLRLLGMSAVLGGITGLLMVLSTRSGGDMFAHALPLWVAILLSSGWLGLMAYRGYYYETKVDELERNANYYGYAVGGGLVFLIYPVWYMFWWAGTVAEPSHEVLMGLMLVAAVAGYLWKKYR